MRVTLYSLPGSHPVRAAKLMLKYVGVEYETVDLPFGSQAVQLRARGFRRGTVPALRIDGKRVQGSRPISRVLDRLVPGKLFPADPEGRRAVEDAEQWGETAYQPLPRRAFRWALARDPNLRRQLVAATKMPAPRLASLVLRPTAAYYARASEANDETVRAELAALPTHLDHIDGLLKTGALGAETLNAADFQIGTTTHLLHSFAQIRPLIEGHPAAEHALSVYPKQGVPVPVELPAAWIPG